jgi:hypothetical protein
VLPQTFIAITEQTNYKEIFESVALQRFQKFLWFVNEAHTETQNGLAILCFKTLIGFGFQFIKV